VDRTCFEQVVCWNLFFSFCLDGRYSVSLSSPKHYFIMKHSTCKNCSISFSYEPMSSGRLRLYCSTQCSLKGKEKQQGSAQCRTCSKSYRPRYGKPAGFCSIECRRYPERKVYESAFCRNQAGHSRRIARKRAAEYETFSALKIFERDNWICGICCKAVDTSKKYPDIYSASLDHIIPLSKGGSHTEANVQCSHFICNSLKADSTQDQMIA